MDQGTPPVSFGSGGALLGQGAGDAISQAMATRGLGGGATSQVSPSAPTYDPSTQPAQPIAPGQAPAAPQQPQQQPGSMNAMGQMTSPSDDTLIIKALTQQLKNNHEIKKVSSGMA